jgi:hypothetical protein
MRALTLRSGSLYIAAMRARLFCLAVVLCLASADAQGSFINYPAREINVKIVYDGPVPTALAANLTYVHGRTPPQRRGKLRSLQTETERVMLFDLVPSWLHEVRGFKVRTHLYANPKSTDHDASRKLVLKGVDALVFVASADPARGQALTRSWNSVKRRLRDQGYDWRTMPIVVQLDRAGATRSMSVEQVRKLMGLTDQPIVLADSTTGTGVVETFQTISGQVLTILERAAATP